MSEMVERVAKAMQIAYMPEFEWDKINQGAYRKMARAAIAAMREPTKAMLDSGAAPYMFSGVIEVGEDVREAWEAMIDEALRNVD